MSQENAIPLKNSDKKNIGLSKNLKRQILQKTTHKERGKM